MNYDRDGKSVLSSVGSAQTHYFVTTMKSDGSCPVCVGYNDTFGKVHDALLNNYSDMYETIYEYAVVEEYTFAKPTGFVQWYKWNDGSNGYIKTDQPEWARGTCCWGIG